MKVLSPHDSSGWITAVIEGRWVQAKVYDKPSSFGVDGGRVSKISIHKTSKANSSPEYHYDRGLEFDNLPKGVLKKVLKELESLPPCAE
jgi:hypothetical protein